MAKEGRRNGKVKATVIKEHRLEDYNIKKADVSTQTGEEEAFNAGDWLEPDLNQHGLEVMVEESSILPQCIRAYKNNIAGFGIGIRYCVDEEETPEMAAEYERAAEIVALLNTEQDTKEVFEDVIEAREKYGIAYLEVLRNLKGEVVQIDFVKDTPSIRKTKLLYPYIDVSYYHNGKETKRKRRFRKYRQQIGGRTVYFKEFGDPRIMDMRDGEYLEEGERLEFRYHANEIMEFAIGTKPYGEVRWVGQILGVDGSRAAENLNNNYFRNGRHTPLMIMVKGGTLTDESFTKLQEYMNSIKGEAGQHSFLVLEAESVEGRSDFEEESKPEIEVKDLANILQKDELFQDYLNNNRKRVQSAFQLPDLYVGYTTDFNRATAQTAQEVTEEQVFQPERKSLAWAINHRLLSCYRFKYVEVYFMAPDISNPDDLYKMMTVANNAGGVTPNFAHEIICEMTGKPAEDFPEEWGNVPINVGRNQAAESAMGSLGSGMSVNGLLQQLTGQVSKSKKNGEPEELVSVMKGIRKALSETQGGDDLDEETSETLDAIDMYIAKADEDLEETLASEGFVAAKDAVIYINDIEDGITAILNDHTDDLVEAIQKENSVPEFIIGTWQQIKGNTELPEALEKLFFEKFEEMMHGLTQEWLTKEVPVLAGLDDRITKSGEAFVREWSGKLADLMHLSTNNQIEKLLIKAVKKNWSIDDLQAGIESSGIRECGYRARRVAVTETLRLESYSQLEAMIQNPLCYKKRWVHTGREKGKPRILHLLTEKDGGVNGQEVYKREKFKWDKYQADCPRDTNLPAEETINCHCIMETVQDENIFGMTDDELKKMRQEMMDEADSEFENQEQ